jgi:hypothetical protein
MLKKSSVVVLLVIVMMFLSSIEVKANENVVGEEVTVEPENQFTSYRSPLDDEIVFDESSYNEVDVVNEEVSVEEDTNLEINEEGIEEREEEEEKDNYIKEKTVKEEVKYLDVVPQTGDSSNLVLWGVLLVVALGATIGLGIYLIKKK